MAGARIPATLAGMPITKIVSGGQTGADRGGLEAAIYCSIPHGGWCPKGRKAEDGRIPSKYRLVETSTSDYLSRTEANVVDADATLIFTYGRPTGGSLRTREFAMKHGKPWHHADLKTYGRKRVAQEVVAWLRGEDEEDDTPRPPESVVLNVAGSRESGAPGIEDLVLRVMVDVLIAAFYDAVTPCTAFPNKRWTRLSDH